MADGDDLQARVAARPYWYHKIELPGGLVTPGFAPISASHYGIPEDLTGKRVLDVGAWDGYWTFQAIKRGAREVVAIDDFSDIINDARPVRNRDWTNFDLCREVLGIAESRVQRHELSIYDLTEDHFGRFDVVFFFGVIYHLRYPLYGLDRLAAVCDESLHIESSILDDFSPYRGGVGKGYPREMVMEFYPDSQLSNNETGWWAPTLTCLAHMARVAGFDHVQGWKLTDTPDRLAFCRGFVKAWRDPAENTDSPKASVETDEAPAKAAKSSAGKTTPRRKAPGRKGGGRGRAKS